MPESNIKEFKKPFALVAILLILVALLIANRILNIRSSEVVPSPEDVSGNRYTGSKLDTEVLADEKFKELKALPKTNISALGTGITESELTAVKRRYSNPFKPF